MAHVLFTEEHEWLSIDGDIATVGITDHAQEQLGDLVFVDLPAVGTAVTKGGDAAVVESVKAASDVFAPIDGEITETNGALEDDPTLVNSGAQSTGWMFKMTVGDKSQLDGLMDADKYKAFAEAEG